MLTYHDNFKSSSLTNSLRLTVCEDTRQLLRKRGIVVCLHQSKRFATIHLTLYPTPMAAPSSATGTSITVPDAVRQAFLDMKQKRAHRWMTFKLDQTTFELSVADTSGPGAGASAGAVGGTGAAAAASAGTANLKAEVAAFVKKLPDSEARYAVFDLPIQNKYGGSGTRLYLFLWAPASAGRSNLFYASQKKSLSSFFSGVEDAQVSSRKAVEDVLLPPPAAAAGGGAKFGGAKKSGGGGDDSDFDPDA